MSTRERSSERGSRRGLDLYLGAAAEFRRARIDRDVPLEKVGEVVGLSASAVNRIERGLVPTTSIVRMAELHAAVGLDLSVRSFPGGSPIREAGHAELLRSFRALLHPSWSWAGEVPLPIPGDQRAWDALVSLSSCRYGVEAETAPRDGQALVRRLQLKLRDGQVDGILLVLPATRKVRAFVAAAGIVLAPFAKVAGHRAIELLAAGVDPGGSAVIVLDRSGRARGGR